MGYCRGKGGEMRVSRGLEIEEDAFADRRGYRE